jgi:hypothetical protein
VSTATLDLGTDAPGSIKQEESGREKEIRRHLARAVLAALPEAERNEQYAEGRTQEWVDRVLRAMSGKGWRVHKSNPLCSRCRVELETEGQAVREYLASPELQARLEAEKAERAAEAKEFNRQREANK